MPLPKPLPEIKQDLMALLVDDIAATISTLQGLLPASAEKRNQTILLEGRLSQITRDRNTAGIVTHDEFMLETSKIRDAMLKLVNGLEDRDFDAAGGGGHAQAAVAAVPKFLIIYDLADSDQSKMLNKHLNVLKIMKKIRVHNVNEVLGGENPVERAKQELADADYLLVLITVNLFNSPDWFEMVFNAMGEGRRIIPIRMEQADFEGTGLEKLRSLPSMNRAVSQFKNPDDAYVDIVTELRKLLPK